MLGFRVWDNEQKKMFLTEKDFERDRLDLSPGYFMDGDFSVVSFSESISYDDGKRFIPMQSTGLKDSKGLEIFEGDFVMFEYEPPLFDKIYLIENVCDLWLHIGHLDPLIYKIRLLGNKYCNPELFLLQYRTFGGD